MYFLKAALILLLFVSSLASFCLADSLPELCRKECTHNFGELLGEAPSGVEAYSNCSNQCVNPEPQFIDKTFTGIKWQCVEYARRWLLVNKKVVYGDVDIAEDIWNLEFVTNPNTQIKLPFVSIVNGDDNSHLQRGDLLIYSRAFYGTGHVAVVLEINEQAQTISVGEQNFNNERWEADYSRELSYIKKSNQTWVLDPYLIGWKRIISD